MTAWTVQLEISTDVEHPDDIEEALAAYDAVVSRIPDEGMLVIAHHEGDSMLEAAAEVERAVLAVVDGVPVLSLAVMPDEVHQARADRPTLPQLVSAAEVAEMLGVSRQRVHQLRSSPGFPLPLYELRTGPIWGATAIEQFARTWDRKPGRRKAS